MHVQSREINCGWVGAITLIQPFIVTSTNLLDKTNEKGGPWQNLNWQINDLVSLSFETHVFMNNA